MWRSRYVSLVILVCGCGGHSNSPIIANDASVVVTISASASYVSRVEPVTLTVTAENRTESRVNFGVGSSSCQLSSLVVVQGQAAPIAVDRVCTADAMPHRLAAGERRSESWQWAGAVLVGNERRMLQPGVYEVHGNAGDFQSLPLLVEIR